MTNPIIELRNVVKHFPRKRGLSLWRHAASVKALDGISFAIEQGETFGLVGESGCGKSTTGKVILRILEPTRGQIWFMGQEVRTLKRLSLLRFRRSIQAVYQDPYASLNPRMRVDHIVGEPLSVNGLASGREKEERVSGLLEKVGLSSDQAKRYPHEFSGGQRQRICIARALALNPQCVVLDEPVSALDVSIRAQILNLLTDLQGEFHLTYLFISHDLSVVQHICDRVAVMYLGKIVEEATTDQLFSNPAHPYTQALLSAVPIADPDYKLNAIPITGEIPNPLNPPAGCRFHPRCPKKGGTCANVAPELFELELGHKVCCHQQG